MSGILKQNQKVKNNFKICLLTKREKKLKMN